MLMRLPSRKLFSGSTSLCSLAKLDASDGSKFGQANAIDEITRVDWLVEFRVIRGSF
jgi:hypothetical protein